MDSKGTGYLTFEVFKKALVDPEDPENDPLVAGSTTAAATGDGLDEAEDDFERIVIAPKRIRELNEAEEVENEEVNVVVLKHIKFQVIPSRKFYKVWDSRKTKALVSQWAMKYDLIYCACLCAKHTLGYQVHPRPELVD